jgi:hypothetical protein
MEQNSAQPTVGYQLLGALAPSPDPGFLGLASGADITSAPLSGFAADRGLPPKQRPRLWSILAHSGRFALMPASVVAASANSRAR